MLKVLVLLMEAQQSLQNEERKTESEDELDVRVQKGNDTIRDMIESKSSNLMMM
jgi:hypothetical protein